MKMKITLTLFLYSLSVLAEVDNKSMQELFKKYDRIVTNHEVALIEEVFSKDFLKGDAAKTDLIEKIKSIPKGEKALPVDTMTWKKGVKGKMYFAKLKIPAVKKEKESEAEFIVIEENGKPKIDGTISDGE